MKRRVRSSWIAGSAVFTTVMSRSSMKVATETTPSVHHLVVVWAVMSNLISWARMVREPDDQGS